MISATLLGKLMDTARRYRALVLAGCAALTVAGILLVAGMAFQDLWTYDFRRTERCLIPYATPLGEISFCAYNTGVGWRHVIEQQLTPVGVRKRSSPARREAPDEQPVSA